MVQLSTPGVTPNRGIGPPWGAFCQITLTSCFANERQLLCITTVSKILKCFTTWVLSSSKCTKTLFGWGSARIGPRLRSIWRFLRPPSRLGRETPAPHRPLWRLNLATFGASLLDAFGVSIFAASAPTAPRFTPIVSRTRSSFGDRTFAAAGPQIWNSLPPNLRLCWLSYGQFRGLPKTFLFAEWSHGEVWTVLNCAE